MLFNDEKYLVTVETAAVFTNFLSIKNKLEAIPQGMDVTVDMSNTRLMDHSVMENLHYFEHNYVAAGGTFQIVGFDEHQPLSKHKLAARKKKSAA